jgi:hypothetical protein
MIRNLFAIVSTVVLGATGASAATQSDVSLEQRVTAAQKTIGALDADAQTTAREGEKVAQYWSNHYRKPWHNWNNWRNYRRY